MRIRVDELPESGKTLVWSWDERQLARFQPEQDPVHIGLNRPIEVDLEVHREADHVRVAGSIRVAARLVCDRCLEDYPWELDQPFETVLLPGSGQPAEDERELSESELDYEFFDGEVIDLEQLVAEEILLALPLQSLCSDECRGLCPGCGANRNRQACRCAAAAGAEAFQNLAIIRKQLPEK